MPSQQFGKLMWSPSPDPSSSGLAGVDDRVVRSSVAEAAGADEVDVLELAPASLGLGRIALAVVGERGGAREGERSSGHGCDEDTRDGAAFHRDDLRFAGDARI